MKRLKIYLTTLFLISIIGNVNAQKKIGVFVHGFNGGSEKWLQDSKVPINWKEEGIIDEFVALDYETMELATPNSQAELLIKFTDSMKEKGNPSQDQWIIIGHSLGGIVARLLYPKFRQFGYNIVAVISVGGPSQGASATDVDKEYISQTISRIKSKIMNAQKHEAWFVTLYLNWQDGIAKVTGETSRKAQIAAIPGYLEVARDTMLGYADDIIESHAKSLIGLNGSAIQEINGYNKNNINEHPQNYLSLIGAEKDKAPIRMIGHIFSDEELKNESENIALIQKLRDEYFKRNEDHFRRLAKRYHWCRTWESCRNNRDAAHYKENLWKAAKLEIDRLGTTWSSLINSYQLNTITIVTYIPPCNQGGIGGFPGSLNIQNVDEECSQNPNGEEKQVTVQMKTSVKNDGVVNIHSALWSANDTFDDDHNVYMKDVHLTSLGDDGGYNHFELRNYARDYTLEENGKVVFKKGVINPAMEEAEDWIRNGYRF
jgi:pimeloyl-ACP methyl ester carboxylesterase